MNVPYYYDELNKMRGCNIPSSLNYKSDTFYYFQRALYQRVASKFEITCPDHWDKQVFLCTLLMLGHVGIFDTNKYADGDASKMFGIIPAPATLSGIGVQMQPTEIRTANPYFYMREPEIIYQGAGLIKLSNDYCGIFDIIDYYAEKLATLSGSIDQSIVNSRFSFAMSANTKQAAETLKAIFDKRNSGDPFIVFDKNKMKDNNPANLGDQEPIDFIDFHVGDNYITDKLFNDYRNIMNLFDAEVGIANNPTEKAERLIVNEVDANNVETVARFSFWMSNLKDSIEKTKKVFPNLVLDIKPTLYNVDQTIGGVSDGNGQNNLDRNE